VSVRYAPPQTVSVEFFVTCVSPLVSWCGGFLAKRYESTVNAETLRLAGDKKRIEGKLRLPLYSRDAATRQRALALEDYFDEQLAPALRAAIVTSLFPHDRRESQVQYSGGSRRRSPLAD
jgi:hypothetical protein